MLPKKSRLPKTEMGGMFSKNFFSPLFLLKSRNNTGENNRFAIIISNQAVPKSVHRHFFKRFFMGNLKKWPNMAKDFIIVVSSRVTATPRESIASEINKALEILQEKNGSNI